MKTLEEIQRRVESNSDYEVFRAGDFVYVTDKSNGAEAVFKADAGLTSLDLLYGWIEADKLDDFAVFVLFTREIHKFAITPPCDPDHNGECLVCDHWVSDCPYENQTTDSTSAGS